MCGGRFLSSDNAVEVALRFDVNPRAVGELFPATTALWQQEWILLVLRDTLRFALLVRLLAALE